MCDDRGGLDERMRRSVTPIPKLECVAVGSAHGCGQQRRGAEDTHHSAKGGEKRNMGDCASSREEPRRCTKVHPGPRSEEVGDIGASLVLGINDA